jgi:uncharacterized membrane protein
VSIQLTHRAGDYIIARDPLAWVHPAQRCTEAMQDELNAAFICGRQLTAEQDIEYTIRQMVEVGVRALSTGINDPRTAINCIDALGSVICEIARRKLPSPRCYDESGKLRIVRAVTTFDSVVDAAFNELRQYGRDSAPVTIRLLEVINVCLRQVPHDHQRRPLLRQAEIIYRQSQAALPEEADRADVQERWERIIQA